MNSDSPLPTVQPHATVLAAPSSAVQPGKKSRWLVYGLVPLMIVFLSVLPFLSALRSTFINWDDDIEIINNPHIAGLTGSNVWWAFTQYEWTRRYQPLDWVSWQANFEIAGKSAESFHLWNLLQHSLCGVVLYLVLLQVLRIKWSDTQGGDLSDRVLSGIAAMGALVWAVHPLRVEPVVWATGRIYTQCALFLLIAFWFYLRAQASASRRAYWVQYGLAVLFFISSLLSYSIVVGAAVGLLLLDCYPLRRIDLSLRDFRSQEKLQVYAEKIPFFLAALGVGLITLWARYHVTTSWAPPLTLKEFSFFSRVTQAAYVLVYYLVRPFWPFGLSPVYSTLVSFNPLSFLFLGSLMVVVGISVLAFLLRKRMPALTFFWIFHVIMLVPLLGLTEHPHYANDRYTHMEEFAWALTAACCLSLLFQKATRTQRSVGVVIAAVVLAGLSILSFQQSKIWRDDETFFSYLVGYLPGTQKADPLWRLANHYRQVGRFPDSLKLLAESLALQPDDIRALDVRALTLNAYAGQLQGDAARALLLESAQTYDTIFAKSSNASSLGFAADAYMDAHDFKNAGSRLERYLRQNPHDPDRRYSLAYVYFRAGKKVAAQEALMQASVDSHGAIDADGTLAQWSAR